MARGRTLKVEILGDASSVKSAFDEAGGKAEGFGGKIGKVAAGAGLALAGVGVAAGVAGVNAIGAFSGFQEQMNEVFTLLPGISESAMADMTGQVKDFSKEFGVLPQETVPALYQALSAGVPQDNVFEFLETAQKAARGGVTELETAVDGISSVVNSYGSDVLGAAEASDQMFTAVRLGKTNFEELSASLFNVVPTASSMGIEFSNVTAALATMTAQGVPTSVATTQLRQAMVEASKSGSDLDVALQDLTGKSFTQLIEEGNSVADVFQLLRENADSDDEFRNLFGSVEAMNAALAITGPNFETFNDNLGEMQQSAGATDQAFEQMDSGIGASSEKIKANLEVLKLEAGERLAPAFAALTDFMLDPGIPTMQQFGAMIAEKVVPVLQRFGAWLQEEGIPALMAFGTFIQEEVVPILMAMGKWFLEEGVPAIQRFGQFIQQVFEDVIQPAIAMLADEVLPELINAWNEISAEVIPTIEALQSHIAKVFNFISDFLEEHWGTISAIAERVWQYISETIGNLVQIISETIQLAMNIIQGDWDEAWQNILGIIQGFKDQILNVGGLLKDGLVALFNLMRDEGVEIMGQLASLAIEKMVALGDWMLNEGGPALVSKLVSGLQNLFSTDTASGVVGVYLQLSKLVGEKILEAAEWMLNEGGPRLVQALIDGLANLIPRVVETFGEVQSAVNEAFINAGQWLLQAGKNIIQGLIDGIRSKIPDLSGTLDWVTDQIPDWKGPEERDKKLLFKTGQTIMGGLIQGIEDSIDRLIKALDTFTRTIVDTVNDALAIPHQKESKEGYDVGTKFGHGVAHGIEDSEPDVARAGGSLGSAAVKGTEDGMEDSAPQIGGAIGANTPPARAGAAIGAEFGQGVGAGMDAAASSPGYGSHFYDAGKYAAEQTQEGWEDEWDGYDATKWYEPESPVPEASPADISTDGAGPDPAGAPSGAGGSGGSDPVGFVGAGNQSGDQLQYVYQGVLYSFSGASQYPQAAANWLSQAINERGIVNIKYTGGPLGSSGVYSAMAILELLYSWGGNATAAAASTAGGAGASAGPGSVPGGSVPAGIAGSGSAINLTVNVGNDELVTTVLNAPVAGMSFAVEA